MISPDDFPTDIVGGVDLYAYGLNNPVMYVDPTGHIAISTFILTVMIGAAIGFATGGAFEIGWRIYHNGWDPENWDLEKIWKAALGGAVAGAITAIPVPGFKSLGLAGKLLSYSMTFALGAAGTLASGKITGAIDFNNGYSIAFGIFVGGFSNVLARGISEIFLSKQASKIANYTRKRKSLVIQKLQGKIDSGFLKGNMRNAFKDYTIEGILKLLETTNPFIKYSIYASFNSAWISSVLYLF